MSKEIPTNVHEVFNTFEAFNKACNAVKATHVVNIEQTEQGTKITVQEIPDTYNKTYPSDEIIKR